MQKPDKEPLLFSSGLRVTYGLGFIKLIAAQAVQCACPQIFVQLGPVLDMLHTLESGSKRIDIIIGQYADVLEDPSKSTKETFHLFKKILDNEVLKRRIHSHPGDSKKKQKKQDQGQGVLDTLLQEFFKASALVLLETVIILYQQVVNKLFSE